MDSFKQLGVAGHTLDNDFPTLKSLSEIHGLSIVDTVIYKDQRKLQDLSKQVGRSINEVEDFLNAITKALEEGSPEVEIPWGSIEDHISSGLTDLDAQLDGGIPIGELTEVFGSSGCGKSQFLLQVAVNSQLGFSPGSRKCIYISTEANLETRRLADMIEFRNDSTLMDNIYHIYCEDLENLDHILFTQLPVILEQEKGQIRSIIIDSIAHHLRLSDIVSNTSLLLEKLSEQEAELAGISSYGDIREKNRLQLRKFFKSDTSYQNRFSKKLYLMLLHQHLITIAQDHSLAVILANQVSDQPDNEMKLGQYDGVEDPLNYDFQLGAFAGWDNGTIMNYQLKFQDSYHIDVNEEGQIFAELQQTLALPNKKPRTQEDFDPRYHKHTQNNFKTLVDKLHVLINRETKKTVPALGYVWSRRIGLKLLLMKAYKPIVKDTEIAVDPETGLTYNDLMDGFNVSTQSEQGKRKLEHGYPSGPRTVESIIDGWRVERFVKVVSSQSGLENFNNSSVKIPFEIKKEGLVVSH